MNTPQLNVNTFRIQKPNTVCRQNNRIYKTVIFICLIIIIDKLYLKLWNINRHLCSPPNIHIPYYIYCGICTLDFFSCTFQEIICIPMCTSTLYLDMKSIRQTNALFVYVCIASALNDIPFSSVFLKPVFTMRLPPPPEMANSF